MKGDRILKTVGVYTENEYLFQKIKLELYSVAEVRLLSPSSERDCDIYLVDADSPRFSEVSGLKMSRMGGDIPLPFRIGSLPELFQQENDKFIELFMQKKAVAVDGREIKLTELEYSLLSLLLSKNGAYVSREEILDRVWDGRADKGIINVYIHYLREKLETGGEKIILSSRNYGYKINERYIGGKSDA